MDKILKYIPKINQLLKDFNLNELIIINKEESFHNASEMSFNKHDIQSCLVFSCIFEYSLPLLIAANRIYPYHFFLCLEPDWLDLRKNKLYLKYGITINEERQCCFYQFEAKPVFVSFFTNFYIYPSVWFCPNRIKFLDLELKSDTPKSSSFMLSNYTNDKLYTRILASNKHVNIPNYIAFVFDTSKYEALENYEYHKIFKITKDIDKDKFLEYFKKLELRYNTAKVVVKPSGRSWMGSKNVFFLKKDDVHNILEAFYKCLKDINDDDSILIDEFIDSRIATTDCNTLGNRLRVYVSRCVDENVKVTGVLANIGPIHSSISGASSNCYSIEYFLNIYELSDNSKKLMEEKIKTIGFNTMESIITAEKNIKMNTLNSQTDFIGLDVVASKDINDELQFYLIEVNDHECISAFANYEIINSPKESQMLDEWIHIMIQRSFNYIIEKKNAVVIDKYGFNELKLGEFFINYKINYIMIDGQENSDSDFYRFFHYYDYKNFSFNAEEHANKISELIKNLNFEVDIVISFNKNLEKLVELIKQYIFTNRNNCNSEYNSRIFTIYRIINYDYDLKSVKISQIKDIFECEYFPLLTKYINNAKFLKKINSQEELLDLYNQNKNSSDECLINLESFSSGSLFYVILIVHKESLVFLKIFGTDKNNQNCSSSLLNEKINHIKYSAHDYCLKNGFDTGIFILKLIFSIQGIKILKKFSYVEASLKKKKYFDACVEIDFLKHFFLMNFQIKPKSFNFESKIFFI